MKKVHIKFLFTTPPVMNTNLFSNPIAVDTTLYAAFQVVFTGVPTGTFSLQGSCDPVIEPIPYQIGTANLNVPVNWSTIVNSPYAVTAAGNYLWNVSEIGFQWIRLVYTDGSSGTSTAVLTNATYSGKSF